MKALMLGWEFPPIINGGLGVACLGMGRALSRLIDVSFILPRVDPAFAVEKLELTGLNRLSAGDLDVALEELTSSSSASATAQTLADFAPAATIETGLFPYECDLLTPAARFGAMATAAEATSVEAAAKSHVEGNDDLLSAFRAGSLYGDDVGEKVHKFAAAAAALSDQRKFDVVHAHDWMTFPAGVAIRDRSGKPLVVHVHSLSYDRAGPEYRGWIYEIEKRALEIADAIIPVSQYTAGIIGDHYGIERRKIVPIHNGSEPVRRFKTPKPFPEKLVLFLGRLTAQKGPEFFLEIAAKVLEETRDVRFVMAGAGEKLRQLIEYGAYRDVGDRFHFTGFLDKNKVNKLLSMTDVYCMPSVSEPFGLSAIEAAQYGIPAVISRQSGVAEVLKRALTADFWDVDLMARHIVTLLEDENAYNRAVAASLEDQKHCTWEAAAEKIVGVYQGLSKDT